MIKKLKHVIFILIYLGLICLFKNSINILGINSLDISVFITIIGILVTAFTILMAINDKPIIEEIIKSDYWEDLCGRGFTPIIYSFFGCLLCFFKMIIYEKEFYIIKIMNYGILFFLFMSIIFLGDFILLLWNILKKINVNSKPKFSSDLENIRHK